MRRLNGSEWGDCGRPPEEARNVRDWVKMREPFAGTID